MNGREAIDLTGQRFGMLLVERRTDSKMVFGGSRPHWICRCDCGTEIELNSNQLRYLGKISCGCTRRKKSSAEPGEFSSEPYSPQELDEAIRLHGQGKTWAEIAKKLRRRKNSLEITVGQYKRGKLKFRLHKVRVETDLIAEDVLNGMSVRDAGSKFGLKLSTTQARLARIGLDSETIAEERELRAE